MFAFALISVLFVYHSAASFLQCSPSDSLESLDDLQDPEYAEKQGVICEKWPFYSGGFTKHSRSSSSSSSSSSDDDDSEGDGSDVASASLLPDTVASDSILYGFDDLVETTQCLESTNGYCTKWVSSKKEYAGKGKDRDEDISALLTEYKLCLCADDNFPILTTMANSVGKYCSVWACLETAEYPQEYDQYSLTMDNSFVVKRSSSDNEEEYAGDYYRFAQNGEALALDESMELMNCWCKAASLNGEYCLNWYCESLEHVWLVWLNGCHREGWFGCDDQTMENTTCNQWYGFLIDNEEREEYRCECVDEACVSWVCGSKEMKLRRNYIWYNFWLALIIWGCLCGGCGTKLVFKKRCNDKCFRCRKCRMFLFFILFGFASLVHGGVPAFMFFMIIFTCSTCFAYKCENTNGKTDTTIATTDKDGENSKDDSKSEDKKVSKSGHVRINSVDLDETDGAIQVYRGTNV